MSAFNRSSLSKKKKSRLLLLSLLSLNLYFLYLLFSSSWLLSATQITGGIALVYFIFEMILKSKKQSGHFPSKRISLIDFIRLSRKYFKIHKRYVLVSTLGLVLATIMISQTILTNSSYQQSSLKNFLKSQDSTAFQIELYEQDQVILDYNSFNNKISTIETVIKGELSSSSLRFDHGTANYFADVSIMMGPVIEGGDGARYFDSFPFTLQIWNEDLKSALYRLPTFSHDLSQNETLLIYGQWFASQGYPFLSEDEVSIVVGDSYRAPEDNTPFFFVNETVNNRWTPTERDYDALYDNGLGHYGRTLSNSLIVSEERYIEIQNSVNNILQLNDIPYYGSIYIEYSVHIEIPDLTTVSIDQLIFELNQMVNSLRSKLRSTQSIQDVWIYSPLAESLHQYKLERESFGVALIMISLPLIGVSLFLVYFSLTLVEKRKSKIISIMKIRGSSTMQLRAMQFAEVMVAGLIAAAVGMILSIPWVLLTFKVSDFFEFEAEGIDLMIPTSWYWRLPQIAIILTIDININSLLNLSDTRIDEGEDTEEKKPPFWQRIYLDLALFSLSVAVLLFVRTFPTSDSGLAIFLNFIIAPWALMMILITSPLVVSRYFSSVISYLSDVLWKIQGGMLALATRNMRKNRFSSSRLTALLMLGMMLSFVSIIIPTSLVSYEIEYTNYNVGSDVYISNLDIHNQTLIDLTNVEGISSRSELAIAEIDLYANQDLNYRGNIGTYYFLGINTSTFTKTAYWRDNYADNSLNEILSKINNHSVGVSNKQLEALGIAKGDQVPNLPSEVNDISVSTTFDYFPNLVTYEPVDYGDWIDAWRMEFLADIEFVSSLINQSSTFETGIYLKLEDSANKTLVDELLAQNFEDINGVNIRSVNQEFSSIQEAEEFKIILSSFQSMLIITILISIIAVSYFTFITLSERNKEIGTFRAIGMVKNQIFVLLIVEAMIMLISGIVFGASLGWFISSNFFYIISNPEVGGVIPPQTLYIPWKLTTGFLTTMFVSTGVAAAYPAQKVASKQTGNVLRAE